MYDIIELLILVIVTKETVVIVMLITCKECGKQYSEYSKSCPHCKTKNLDQKKFERNCFDFSYKDKYFSYMSNQKPIAKRLKENTSTADKVVFTICGLTVLVLIILVIYVVVS